MTECPYVIGEVLRDVWAESEGWIYPRHKGTASEKVQRWHTGGWIEETEFFIWLNKGGLKKSLEKAQTLSFIAPVYSCVWFFHLVYDVDILNFECGRTWIIPDLGDGKLIFFIF